MHFSKVVWYCIKDIYLKKSVLDKKLLQVSGDVSTCLPRVWRVWKRRLLLCKINTKEFERKFLIVNHFLYGYPIHKIGRYEKKYYKPITWHKKKKKRAGYLKKRKI